MTNLVQIAVAGDVAEGEQLQELLTAAGIDSRLEPAVEHHETALEDAPLKVLVESRSSTKPATRSRCSPSPTTRLHSNNPTGADAPARTLESSKSFNPVQ